jgi:hypothetical protein
MFSIPMAIGTVVMSRWLLYLLRPKYVVVQPALVVLALTTLLASFAALLDSTLLGLENVDANEDAASQQFRGTALSFVPKVNLSYSVGYIASALVAFIITSKMSILNVVLAWAFVQFMTTAMMVLVKIRRVRQKGALSWPQSIGKYALGSVAMAIVAALLSEAFLKEGFGSLTLGSRILGVVAVSTLVYFGALYAIDSSFRRLVRNLLSKVGFGEAQRGQAGSQQVAP